MDDIDRANHQAEQILAFQRAVRKPTLQPKGTCYYCDDHLKIGIFCCPECREDWEKEQRIKAMRGRGDD